jgi:hypothetical protein
MEGKEDRQKKRNGRPSDLISVFINGKARIARNKKPRVAAMESAYGGMSSCLMEKEKCFEEVFC